MNYIVYKHTTPSGKIYIGITSKKAKYRWGKNGNKYKKNKHFYSAILKYGWENIEHEILFENLTKEEACQKEIELIAYYRSNEREFGYNKSIGGEINMGYHLSDETKKTISEVQKGKRCGKDNPFYGKTHSKEQREKWSKERKGVPLSEERRKKLYGKQIGKIQSEETKEKLSNAMKGRSISESHKKKYCKEVLQYDKDGNFIAKYKSAVDAGLQLNISNSRISSCCRGETKICNGFIFRYSEDFKADKRPKRAVQKIDLKTNKIIETFESASEAAAIMGVSSTSIYNVCKGKAKTSCGFGWSYAAKQ